MTPKNARRELGCASPQARGDKDLVLAAVQLDPLSFGYAGEDLRADQEFLLAAMRLEPFVFQCAAAELLHSDDFVQQAVAHVTFVLNELPQQFGGSSSQDTPRRFVESDGWITSGTGELLAKTAALSGPSSLATDQLLRCHPTLTEVQHHLHAHRGAVHPHVLPAQLRSGCRSGARSAWPWASSETWKARRSPKKQILWEAEPNELETT